MIEKNEFELIVSEGNRPLWMRIIAAVFFTKVFYSLFQIVQMFWNLGFNEYTMLSSLYLIKVIICCFLSGIASSVVKTVLIDVDKDKLISRYSVGSFSRDVLSEVPSLEYVSVFLDAKQNYQVNLWYKGNKHYTMFYFDEKLSAMQFGSEVAIKLNLDLLDATEKGDFKWIDKTEYESKSITELK